MTVKIEFHTDNAAFQESEESYSSECARILHDLAVSFLEGHFPARKRETLWDSNGNRIGEARIDSD